MELRACPVRPRCQRWLASIPPGFEVVRALRVWTASKPWGNGAGWSGGALSQHQTYINRSFPLAAGHQSAMGWDFCLPGWSGGAFPELDYIKTNNINWYPQPPANMPFIYDQCWQSAPPLHPGPGWHFKGPETLHRRLHHQP